MKIKIPPRLKAAYPDVPSDDMEGYYAPQVTALLEKKMLDPGVARDVRKLLGKNPTQKTRNEVSVLVGRSPITNLRGIGPKRAKTILGIKLIGPILGSIANFSHHGSVTFSSHFSASVGRQLTQLRNDLVDLSRWGKK